MCGDIDWTGIYFNTIYNMLSLYHDDIEWLIFNKSFNSGS